jgi:hypothetical protein
MEIAIVIIILALLIHEFHAWARLSKRERDR